MGHDVLTIYADGKGNQRLPDEEVLAAATAYNRALLTINRKHFRKLHLRSSEHSGIICCTYDPDFAQQAQRIHEVLLMDNQLPGQLLMVYRPA